MSAENEAKADIYEDEARQRYGDEVVERTNERLSGMSESERQDKDALEREIIERLSKILENGIDVKSDLARELAEEHATWIRTYWGDDAYCIDKHLSLAESYRQDARFADYYDSQAGQGAAEVLADVLEEHLPE